MVTDTDLASKPVAPAPYSALILFAICTLAFTFRVLFLAQWAETPLFHNPLMDELNFHKTALGLLGQGPAVEDYFFQPLYSYYLWVLYHLFGPDLALVRTLQIGIGLVNCLIFYGLGKALAGVWVGRVSALLVALYGPLIFFEGHMLDPVLTVPLTAASLWCFLLAGQQKRTWLCLLGGLFMGLAIMGRPNLGILLPIGGLWLYFRPWTFSLRVRASLMALVGLTVGLLPSWIHNVRQGEGWIPVSSSGGLVFFLGNNPAATGRFHIPPETGLECSTNEKCRATIIQVAEQAEGRQLSSSEVSNYWYRRTLTFFHEHPARAAFLFAKKFLQALNAEESPIHHPYVFGQQVAPLLNYTIGFAVVFPFFALGIFFFRRRDPGQVLLLAGFVAYLLSLVAFYITDRYRILLLPMMLPLAAYGMVELQRRFGQKSAGQIIPAVMALLAAFAMTQIPLSKPGFENKAIVRGYNHMAMAAVAAEDWPAAENYFRQVVELGPETAPSSDLDNLGRVLLRRGKNEESKQIFLQLAKRHPRLAEFRMRLAILAERAGQLQEALNRWREVARRSPDPSLAQAQLARLEALLAKARTTQ